MATHSHDGLVYEALGIEFQEFSRSGFSSRPSLDISGMASVTSGLNGDDRAHNDGKSLIANKEASEPESILNKASNDCETPSQLLRKRRHRFKSWKVGVTSAAAMTTTVLLVNLVLTVWASVRFSLDDGIGTVYEGACSTVSAWSFWLHILINGLSSMLLGASNYTMQCVTAPTRRECDLAHARGDWLDVGVPSVRNLSRISWKRRIMWTLLAFSSMPIHLLYNSAVFKTLDDNSYIRLIVGRKFLEKNYQMPSSDAIMNTKSTLNIRYSSEEVFAIISTMHESYFSSSFKNLSIDACISTYATYYLSGHSNVFLVADDTDNEIIPVEPASAMQAPGEFGWICAQGNGTCKNLADVRSVSTQENWMINGVRIEYCMSQTREQHCKLQFSIGILIAVLLCNFIKCTTMFWVVWQQRDTTFITFGDAIASWLDQADPSIANLCTESVRSITHKSQIQDPRPSQPITRETNHITRRWMSGVSRRRWAHTATLITAAIVTSCVSFGLTIDQMLTDTGDTIISLGFGVVNANMLLSIGLPSEGTSGLASSILFANLPQIIMSFVYLSYNALITCMLLANEYSGYEVHRKTLRVTTPCGQQRSTYWLQLPYTYGIPVMVASATLHWLISQSLFLVRVDAYNDGVLVDSDNVSGMGLSPAPMLAVIILGVILLAAAIGLGFRKLEGNEMPVAASCSLALAAAAHRPAGDVDAAFLPVRWGEVVERGTDDLGHCCFTSQEVFGIRGSLEETYHGFHLLAITHLETGDVKLDSRPRDTRRVPRRLQCEDRPTR